MMSRGLLKDVGFSADDRVHAKAELTKNLVEFPVGFGCNGQWNKDARGFSGLVNAFGSHI